MSHKVISEFDKLSTIATELLSISESAYFEEDNIALRVKGTLYHFIKSYTSENVTVYMDDHRLGKFHRMVWVTEDCFIFVTLENEDVEMTLRFEVKGF